MKHKVIKYLLLALVAAALGLPIEYVLIESAVKEAVNQGLTDTHIPSNIS